MALTCFLSSPGFPGVSWISWIERTLRMLFSSASMLSSCHWICFVILSIIPGHSMQARCTSHSSADGGLVEAGRTCCRFEGNSLSFSPLSLYLSISQLLALALSNEWELGVLTTETNPHRPSVRCAAIRIERLAFTRVTLVPFGIAEWLARVDCLRRTLAIGDWRFVSHLRLWTWEIARKRQQKW